MRLPSRKLRWVGLAAAVLAAGFLVARAWLVKAIIVRQIEAQYHGKVVVGDWWLGWNSSGLRGVKLYETPRPGRGRDPPGCRPIDLHGRLALPAAPGPGHAHPGRGRPAVGRPSGSTRRGSR